MTNLPAAQEAQTPAIVSGDSLDLLMRQADAMGAAHKLATVLCNTQMVPASFRGKPDDGAAAILYGAELGLKPQQALQQIFIIHGQPAIYARTMVALLKAKGYRFQTLESTDEKVTVQGTSPAGEVETATWSIDRAKKAGYVKNSKYQSDPQAMLYAKAASEVSRRLAPDVLLGIKYTAEDLEIEPVKMTATRTDIKEKAQAPVPAISAPAEVKSDLDNLLDTVRLINTADELKEFMSTVDGLADDEYERLSKAANIRWAELSKKGE